MEEKIEVLKVIRDNLDIMISMLEGEWKKEYLDGKGTILEQIGCYDCEGEVLQETVDLIIKEHGSELCPFDDGD